jgi:uncharacterized membrane protein
MEISVDTEPSDLRLALDLHFKQYPDSPIQAVVASPDIKAKLADFDKADATALQEQRSYRRFGRFALWSMLIGTIIGAVALLPITISSELRSFLEASQGLAMMSTFVAVTWIWLRRPAGHWMQSRAAAEMIRGEVFRTLIEAGAQAKDLLAPALYCFRDAHLKWQLGFYRKRGPEHRRAAGHLTPLRVAGYVLLFAALLCGFAGLVKFAAQWGWSWPPLAGALEWIPLERPGRWQLGLGAIASSILAFASARSYMDQDDRNATCYELAARELEALERDGLPKAEAAANAGRDDDVRAFCSKVQAVLFAEHNAWLYARPPENVPYRQAPGLRV